MSLDFKDESSVVTVFRAGSSGSWEFGSSTPASASCECTMDGFGLNNGSHIGDSRVTPVANARTTGTTSSIAPGGSTTISTSKTVYALISNDSGPAVGGVYTNIDIQSQSIGSFVLENYDVNNTQAGARSCNYSFL